MVTDTPGDMEVTQEDMEVDTHPVDTPPEVTEAMEATMARDLLRPSL